MSVLLRVGTAWVIVICVNIRNENMFGNTCSIPVRHDSSTVAINALSLSLDIIHLIEKNSISVTVIGLK